MKILELFSGTESFANVARARGHEVFTIDNSKKFTPPLNKNIMNIEANEIIEAFGYPDVIWASPPCTRFSIATHRHWENQEPRPDTTRDIDLLHHTLKLIFRLHPKYWFLENPKGRMRWILGLPPKTLEYGAYGHWCLKTTDIWGFHPKFKIKEVKKDQKLMRFADAHNGKDRTVLRSVVPAELCEDILKACERDIEYSLNPSNTQSK